ncbi:MAG: FtsL-like putative cell division protein [Flavobacteriaceae bacterium]|jgi:hypothetical protein
MKKWFLSLFKGSFLVSEDAARNWRFILYVFSLFVVMIYAAHSADQKVVRIDQLNKELQGLRNEHIEGRRAVQQSRLESSMRQTLEVIGLKPSENPPVKIIVE